MGSVLIVTGPNPFQWSGGIETYVLNLYGVLKEEGWHVDVDFFEKHGLTPYKLEDYYNHARIIKEKADKYDFIISNSIYGAFIEMDINKILNICHGVYRDIANVCRNFLNKCDYLDFYYRLGLMEDFTYSGKKVVSVSSSVTSSLRRHFRTGRIITIRNFVDTNVFKPLNLENEFSKSKKLKGLYVGRTDATKGYDIFIEVYKRTQTYIEWVQCLSTGGLREYAEIEEIQTYKSIPHEDMPYIYNKVDFVFFPSRYEGFGFTSVEALACGRPVIAYETGIFNGLSKLLPHLSLGEPNQKNTLDTVDRFMEIIKLVEDINFRKHIRRYGRYIANKFFNKEIWKRKWLSLLNKRNGI
ncbi:MAG: glycosyltransferase family 4 protein [Aquificaceae bacterium]|jgi:glycosyltransferase involved in cell wall biosynthesis|uniref:glycosyltransferase family 4 protein n=1 Tax=Hydrogenobacter sp. Uz 6-8 TaxID=3384828 RepID=UPI0030B4588F